MSTKQLKAKLYVLAIQGVKDANKNMPFTSKSKAFQALNYAKQS